MSRHCIRQGAMTHGLHRGLRPYGQAPSLSTLLHDMAIGASRGTSSSSSVPPKPPANRPPWQEQPLRWARRVRARAELARDEWRDRADEYRDRGSFWIREQRRRLEDVRAGRRPTGFPHGLSVNDFLERTHTRYLSANQRFDEWFNAQWPLFADRVQVKLRNRRDRLVQKLEALAAKIKASAKSTQPASGSGPPVDAAAMALMTAGVGSAIQGLPGFGMFLVASGAIRASWRFVMGKLDDQDIHGLFRWAPASFRARRFEIFQRLQREVGVGRAIRAGDPQFVDSMYDKRHHKAMNPENDYTPEKLFDDAMSSLAEHPRIKEILGGEILDVQEPDKVVYRIVEGVSEVYLGWRIAGRSGGAEIQVKATASLLDFIYVFPDPAGRYGMAPASFVIRPKGGAWSMNVDELPNNMKMPFGEAGDSERLLHNRKGVFEMDWSVRDFRHGKENIRGWGNR